MAIGDIIRPRLTAVIDGESIPLGFCRLTEVIRDTGDEVRITIDLPEGYSLRTTAGPPWHPDQKPADWQSFYDAIVSCDDPGSAHTAVQVFADYLQENGRPHEAAAWRLIGRKEFWPHTAAGYEPMWFWAHAGARVERPDPWRSARLPGWLYDAVPDRGWPRPGDALPPLASALIPAVALINGDV